MKQSTLLLALLCIVLFIGLEFRTMPPGVDTYDYLSQSFGRQKEIVNKGPFINILFSHLPNNFHFWNALAILCLFACCWIIGKTGELFNPEYGSWSSLFAFSSTVFPIFIFQFEPSSIGMVLLLASLYFFIKNSFEPNLRTTIFLGLGSLFWKGAALFLIGFGLYSVPYFVAAFITVAFNWTSLMAGVTPNLAVMENYPVWGGLVLLVLFGIRFTKDKENILNWKEWFGIRTTKGMGELMALGFVLAFLSFKYLIIAIPFFVINFAATIKGKFETTMIAFFSIIALVMILFTLPILYPTDKIIEAIQYGISVSKDGNVQNDYGIGHYIVFMGGSPSNRYGPTQNSFSLNPDLNFMTYFDCDKRPIITSYDLNSDYERINNFGLYKIYCCKRVEQWD
jgi:hypothetical protein